MKDKTNHEELWDRYRNGDIDRRTFLKGLAGVAAAAGVVGGPFGMMPGVAHAADKGEIRFDTWGGTVIEAFQKNAIKPYQKKTGVEVVAGTFGNADQYLARVKSSQPGAYQIAHLSGVFDYARYTELGLNSVIDESKIPRLKLVIDRLVEPFRKLTDGHISAVPYDYGATGIAYNRKYISDDEVKEKGASILIDKKYKDKISGWAEWKTRIWYAALQTDQNPNDIQDMDAIWNAVRKNRDLVLKYWHSGAELMKLLASEEIWVTEGYSGRIRALQDQGYDIGYMDPPGGLAWQECMFIIKGSPMEPCEKFINFLLKPEVAIAVAEAQKYPPSLNPNKVDLGDVVPTLPAFDPKGTLEDYDFFDPTYWNKNEAKWAREFSRVQRGY